MRRVGPLLKAAQSRVWGRPDPGAAAVLGQFQTACNAPFVSMYFDQHGIVRACCQNWRQPLGSVLTDSIRTIWDRGAAPIREALANDDFSLGCQFCAWQAKEGNVDTVFARTFDRYPVAEPRPRWPLQMEFSLSNACNLQCGMCNGDLSSAIRAHREHLPPLPRVYGDAFFEELAEFLPHLESVKLLGGEPFLGAESLRVMEMLADIGSQAAVTVTTNGTLWSPRIKRICERLNLSYVVSLDSHVPEVYEQIRVGATFSKVIENLERFCASAEQHGTDVSLAHCLMCQNWRHFAGFLHFAEDRGLNVGVNTVTSPPEFSLYRLPASELREVVAVMEAQDVAEAATLGPLRPVWEGQLGALQHRLAVLTSGSSSRGRAGASDVRVETSPSVEARRAKAKQLLESWGAEEVAAYQCDETSTILAIDSPDGTVFGVTAEELLGRPSRQLQVSLEARFGPYVERCHLVDDGMDRVMLLYGHESDLVDVHSVAESEIEDWGLGQRWITVGWRPHAQADAAVAEIPAARGVARG